MNSKTIPRRPRKRKLSACQRVGETICDKNTEADPTTRANEGERKYQTLLWPESIPREERIPSSCGHRSFVTPSIAVPGLRRSLSVNIRDHVLACCDLSYLLIESEHEPILIEPGHSVILSDTLVTLTEIPGGLKSRGIHFYFFGDAVLSKIVSMNPRENVWLHSSVDYPCDQGVIPVRESYPFLHAFEVKSHLKPMLTWIMNRVTYPFWKLCLNRILCPRIRIQLFLENLILLPMERHASVLEKFPGGKNALLRQMTRFNMPSIASLVDQRRIELCYAWNTHGKRSFAEIFQALRVSQPARFRRRYEKWLTNPDVFRFSELGNGYGDTLLAAHASYLPNEYYWKRRGEQTARAERIERMKTDPVYKRDQDWMLYLEKRDRDAFGHSAQMLFAKPEPLGELDSDFWELKSTGVKMLIKAEKLTTIPGLEDCDKLLLAA